MANTSNKLYVFSGYNVFPYTEESEFGWKWYVNIKDSLSGESTKIKFKTLKESKDWCRKNYMAGVVHGWIK